MYAPKDFSILKGMPGFSDAALDVHFKLYEGYVNNTNKNFEILEKIGKETVEFAEVKRRFGWEFDGMRLHEYYFGNLGGNGILPAGGKLLGLIEKNFGSFENWKADFIAAGKMRGIGWVALYQDGERLMNFWINEHDGGHPAGLNLLLIMDVFEHAYFPDYKSDRAAYINAFMKNINWAEVEQRVE